MKRYKQWKVILLVAIGCFIAVQFIRPRITHPPVTGEPDVPPEVSAVLRKACYDCHSNETHLAWFDQISPAIWLVAGHITEGRRVLNFSNWDSIPKDQQKGKLFESLNQMQFNVMPLSQYTALHPAARLTNDEISILKNYLATQLAPLKPDRNKTAAANLQYAAWHPDSPVVKVMPVPNGIAYMPEYKNWEAISSTQRLDNGTMRVITGNDIAVKAIREHQTNPWPDGTAFAKIAWDELPDAAGNITPGEFKQVEFMIKDSHKYASTKGWGWARWKGTALKPYGKNAMFTMECVNCHQPMRNNDFVFTAPTQHTVASLPDTLGLKLNEWKVITSGIQKDQTMSTLYGNERAVASARKGAATYPADALLTLVTWKQQPDDHWFGAVIPGIVASVEQVQFQPGNISPLYKKYNGKNLVADKTSEEEIKSRIAYITRQRASVMP
ncbi:hypothetical protein QFZ48_005660 [Chitinophaga sp. W2I13]|uniref:cytochrome P460 family protein n=1 Tax=Chitinophaga sp. W2I13 TaxID=3373923 RepID=UPI003D1B6631